MTEFANRSKDYSIGTVHLLIAISLLLTFNCAGISEKSVVQDNLFVSPYPKIEIKVSPELKYVGEYRGDVFSQARFDMDMKTVKIERVSHIFCQKGNDGNVKRGIVISTRTVPEGYYWFEPFTSEKSKKNKIDIGEIDVGNMKWRYAIGPTKNFFGSAKDFVHNAGYSTTNHHLMCVIGRIMTANKDTIMFIYYIEDQGHCGFPHVMFSEGKRKFIDGFMQRGFNTMQFGRKIERTPEKVAPEPTTVRRTPEKPSIPTQEKRLTYIPKEVKEAKIPKIRLRSTPKPVYESDIENMIGKHNFFIKYKNETGYFPNDFVDNGDGTVTDRVTGLMWEKAGSESAMRYWSTEKYVSRLNKQMFAGHNDWRIPTAEELASLLERERNNRGLHIAPVFDARQKVCWSADTFESPHRGTTKKNIIDFSEGTIDDKFARHFRIPFEDQCFVRTVRSIK